MKDRPRPNSKPAAAADFFRQAGMDQTPFGAEAPEQGFHAQQKASHDARVALPRALPELLPRTLPPEEQPTDSPEAYSTGEFSFPDVDEDDLAFLSPPPPSPLVDDLRDLGALFGGSPGGSGPLPAFAAGDAGAAPPGAPDGPPSLEDARTAPARSEVEEAEPPGGPGGPPRGPGVARRMWRARAARKPD
jgi:hypothetical protein